MSDPEFKSAPNYTTACLVMFGVNIMWIFTVIWAVWGLLTVILLGAFINHFMTRLHIRAQAKAALQRAHPRASARR